MRFFKVLFTFASHDPVDNNKVIRLIISVLAVEKVPFFLFLNSIYFRLKCLFVKIFVGNTDWLITRNWSSQGFFCKLSNGSRLIYYFFKWFFAFIESFCLIVSIVNIWKKIIFIFIFLQLFTTVVWEKKNFHDYDAIPEMVRVIL